MITYEASHRPVEALTAQLIRDISAGKLALVEVYADPDWLQILPSGGKKKLHGGGVYYLLRMAGDVPKFSSRRVYSISFLDRLMTFCSNCIDVGDVLLSPTQARSGMSGAWDNKIAKFLSKHDLLQSSRGTKRVWLVNKPDLIAFLKKVNNGDIEV